jgi:hypothetical protein
MFFNCLLVYEHKSNWIELLSLFSLNIYILHFWVLNNNLDMRQYNYSWFPAVARVYRGRSSWTVLKLSVAFYNLRDKLLHSIYPWLRNRCLAINYSSLLVSADMSHVPVARQRPGWNIYISLGLSALWAECHISPCLYSYLYNHVKEGNETIPLTERQLCRNIHTYLHTFTFI